MVRFRGVHINSCEEGKNNVDYLCVKWLFDDGMTSKIVIKDPKLV